ncbi:MAG: MmgE/PrpD family protein [Negativicutes bacterium]|nr:MmgE/PrpD family protein [Negativicutes bacterium]
MSTVTGKLADFVVNTDFADLPEKVAYKAKECIFDTLGVALAGAKFPDVTGITAELKKVDQQQDCVIWGMSEKASLLNATLINGAMSHAIEMDDVHKTSKTHTGAVVVPAALTLGSYRRTTGKQLISAVVAGYEVAYRIGTGINAAAHRLQGWHATGTCCPFGAAAAASKLMGLDQSKTVSALGMAGTQSSGLWALTEDGATCKKFYMGRAAQSGILAAIMATGGMTGPSMVLESKDGGLFAAASSNYDFEVITRALGQEWEIMKVDRKPFACCRSAQPPIDAILQLRKEFGIQPENVKQVIVNTYDIAVKQCFNTKRPQNVVEAQLCIPYTVAVALYDGAAFIEQFTSERIKDEAVLALAQKVEVISDPEFTALYPQNWGCQLILETMDGKRYEKVIKNAKGDFDNPLSFEDLVGKFKGLAYGVLPLEQQDKIVDMVFALEKVEDIAQMVELLGKK